jgi:hypothetical protein
MIDRSSAGSGHGCNTISEGREDGMPWASACARATAAAAVVAQASLCERRGVLCRS